MLTHADKQCLHALVCPGAELTDRAAFRADWYKVQRQTAAQTSRIGMLLDARSSEKATRTDRWLIA
ncbi:hypothetical protein DPMN_072552 [Dreissena polymorpha]|uniref:Uncharacterized protein n=1 Tax=Dreissena polymorpha TaxID=45954 RepID=A0A9D3Z6F1_DREPO|nr:hypothetical protein DPMN_072552 [Dreissena polymorpha]